jgi:hypothetical protein
MGNDVIIYILIDIGTDFVGLVSQSILSVFAIFCSFDRLPVMLSFTTVPLHPVTDSKRSTSEIKSYMQAIHCQWLVDYMVSRYGKIAVVFRN